MDPTTSEVLKDLFRTKRAQENAVPEGLAALERLAKAVVHRDSGQAVVIRRFLLSLFNGENERVDLSEVMRLDWALRKDLCSVILTVGSVGFPDTAIREAFAKHGGVDWFLAEVSSSTS